MNEKILEIVRKINPYEDIVEESKLIDDGILDSLTLVILINEIEEVFHIKMPEDKLQPESFETVSKIAELVSTLLGEG